MVTGEEEVVVAPLFVAIAVARPDDLDEVRGAIPSATRLSRWAALQGYEVELVTDEAQPVTCATLAAVFKRKLGNGGQPRIVVSFAGHGLIRGGAEEYWLLTHWRTQPTEAVNFLKLRDRLGTYLPKQIATISDACRSLPTERAKWVEGNGVVEIKDYVERPVQFAHLAATRAAQPAYATPLDASESYCFFTQVLTSALCGHPVVQFEQDTSGQPIVTEDRLFDVVERELPLLASRHGRRQVPELQGGWRSPNNVWSILRDDVRALVKPPLTPTGAAALPATRNAISERKDFADARAHVRTMDFVQQLQAEDRATHFETGCGLVVVGAAVEEVVAGLGVVVERDGGGPEWFRLTIPNGRAAPVALRLATGAWVAAAAYGNFIGTFTVGGEGAKSYVLRRLFTKHAPAETAVAEAATGGSLGDPYDLAARLRDDKHDDPVLGALAAYAYARVGAIDEVRRMCAYYGLNQQPAPFDAVLLARAPLVRDADGYICEIPAVAERLPRNNAEKMRFFTYQATPAVQVRVAGSCPWLRQGWALLEDDFRPEFRGLASLASGVRPDVFTTLTPLAGRDLADRIRRGVI
jgi:hypothetical protein